MRTIHYVRIEIADSKLGTIVYFPVFRPEQGHVALRDIIGRVEKFVGEDGKSELHAISR